ncbi:MAG TPA: DegT/DnrJ/EryC1/StrS family aminotransferase [Blastocatellia bacterium]|nr:DegT/DnrJ/EryC1/StrS family aminotransferase [Blastocatellia bacterium]
MKVPLLDLRAQFQTIRGEVMAAVERVFESQHFVLGPEVEAFERDAAEYCQVRHAIGCGSGSDALLLALTALGVGPGDEVVTPSFTFFATAGSITRLGARAVFVDISPDDFNIDPEVIERAITPRAKAILPVHLFGQCAEMEAIREVAERHSLPVIEDAAQAIGAEYHKQRAGAMGAVGCFSFFPSKNLGGAGEGGLMTTDDDNLAEKLRLLRVHGMRPKYHHQVVGVNSRLDALQAAVLRVKLKYLDQWSDARRRNAEHYDRLFAEAGVEEVVTPAVRPNRRHIFNQYTIRCSRRDELMDFLKRRGVGSEIYYPTPLHLQECFAYLGYKPGDLPVTERTSRECLSLPIYPELTEEMRWYVVDTVAEFYRSS